MNTRLILVFVLLLTHFTTGADLKVFTEPRQAISFARTEGKLIVFFLWDSRDKKHLKIAEKLKTDLNRLNSEFILVNLTNSQKVNRDLFTGRFAKDLSTMPVAVISNQSGEAVASTQGLDKLEYDRLLLNGRINGGQITDPLRLVSLKESLAKVGQVGGFLTPMVEDLKQQKVAITKMRVWKRKDGSSFEAILLEALGEQGVFVDKAGDSSEVKFTDLSAPDIKFLQTVLRTQ